MTPPTLSETPDDGSQNHGHWPHIQFVDNPLESPSESHVRPNIRYDGGSMKWIFTTMGPLFLLCSALTWAQKMGDSADRSQLVALENAWNQAQIHRDGKALDELITDRFIYTDWDGTVMNKAEFIADSKDPAVSTSLVANDHVDVYFYPGVAIVAGAYHAKGTNRGKPFDHYGRFTDTWIFSNGKWVCAASHTNLLKK